jgi:hypothetical protein
MNTNLITKPQSQNATKQSSRQSPLPDSYIKPSSPRKKNTENYQKTNSLCISQQENYSKPSLKIVKEGTNQSLLKSFKIKIPYFPKKPFGKHDSLNNSELSFIEMNIKHTTHNLYEKNTKFYKIVCGRASSLGRKRDKSTRRHFNYKII